MEPTRAVSSTDRAARSMPAVWRLLVTCVQLLLLLTLESSEAARTYSLQEGAVTSRRLQAFTDSKNLPRHGPANESFHLSDGSWVDCVPIENQIAAHHPNLQDHVIQNMVPPATSQTRLLKSPRLRTNDIVSAKNNYEPGRQPSHPQLFAREHGGCREGFIPVQRISDLINRQRLKTSGPRLVAQAARCSTSPRQPGAAAVNMVDCKKSGVHEYAGILGEERIEGYSGQGASLSVNQPFIADQQTDFSLSQLWVGGF
jgi:hypothetical protein